MINIAPKSEAFILCDLEKRLREILDESAI